MNMSVESEIAQLSLGSSLSLIKIAVMRSWSSQVPALKFYHLLVVSKNKAESSNLSRHIKRSPILPPPPPPPPYSLDLLLLPTLKFSSLDCSVYPSPQKLPSCLRRRRKRQAMVQSSRVIHSRFCFVHSEVEQNFRPHFLAENLRHVYCKEFVRKKLKGGSLTVIGELQQSYTSLH